MLLGVPAKHVLCKGSWTRCQPCSNSAAMPGKSWTFMLKSPATTQGRPSYPLICCSTWSTHRRKTAARPTGSDHNSFRSYGKRTKAPTPAPLGGAAAKEALKPAACAWLTADELAMRVNLAPHLDGCAS
eukprot:6489941-Amphidinium_carterae.2